VLDLLFLTVDRCVPGLIDSLKEPAEGSGLFHGYSDKGVMQ